MEQSPSQAMKRFASRKQFSEKSSQ